MDAPRRGGRLWAINPENGFFGVAPGTSVATNPVAMATIDRDTLYTNVALAPDGTPWWEGHDRPAPEGLLDWQGRPWDGTSPAAHPNARFTAPLANCPTLAAEARDPRGVPIDAILFGARRATTMPLVHEARNWAQGVYLGGTLASETTAAATGTIGVLRRDPMAMLPFLGYHLGDYLQHWLDVGAALSEPPRIFGVNWFRKDARGAFTWPGFGDNLRVLGWVLDRCDGRVGGLPSPLGVLPRREDLDLEGLDAPHLDAALTTVPKEVETEAQDRSAFILSLAERCPTTMRAEAERLLADARAPESSPIDA